MKLSWRKFGARRRLIIAVSLVIVATFAWFYEHVRLPSDRVAIESGVIVYSSDETLLHAYLNADQQLVLPATLGRIHPHLVACALAAEDKRFYRHFGVDLLALARAAWQNLKAVHVVSGASTIPMQLARLADPAPRTLISKFVEMVRAVQLDRRFGKSAILEMYLNRLPFGGNVVGVEAAARVYFGKSAENLGWAEAALLMGIPKNPNRFNPLRYPNAALQRKNAVLYRLRGKGIIDEKTYREAVSETHAIVRRPLSFLAPHFCEWVRREAGAGPMMTTLDREFQTRVENIIRTHRVGLERQNARHVAVIVLDNRTRGVLAYVGSPDFFDAAREGQVQGPLSIRSPGSALKPFLTALALEEGLITPMRKLPDVPTHYIGLDPENFNREYDGFVTVRDAIKWSLNIPAARLLELVGPDAFKNFLEKNRFEHLSRDASYYGLGLVLGGCGVTLVELTNAYATLASGGLYRPVRPMMPRNGRDPEVVAEETRLYSEPAAHLVREMLKDEDHVGEMTFGYKTGTSADHKDAWCVGFTPDITVGVWCGNFSGESARVLVGRTAALPITAKILHLRRMRGAPRWFARPDGVGRRRVCAVSGLPPNPFCHHTMLDDFLPGRTKTPVCPVHARIFVSEDGREQYCAACVEDRPYMPKTIERYSPEVANFFESKGMHPFRIPPHHPDCAFARSERSEIRILEPTADDIFHGDPATRVPIRAASTKPDREFFIFLDDRFWQRLTPLKTAFYKPTRGRHILRIVDETGAWTSLSFDVR